ncbi:serpin family protein [Planctomicrobium sp. SH661]|uniref:serpin family protein n=1 Tax=Planctomicrobium sp. SH661 TaxID=3448124 RepID=UPI003F5C95B1
MGQPVLSQLGWRRSISLLSVFLCCTFCPAAEPEQDFPRLIEAEQRFTSSALSCLNQTEGLTHNTVISTYQLFESLSILHSGSRGQTEKELRQVLHLPEGSVRLAETVDQFRTCGYPVTLSFPFQIQENATYGVKLGSLKFAADDTQAVRRTGDLIFTVNDQPVRTVEDFQDEIRRSTGRIRISGYQFHDGTQFLNETFPLTPRRTKPVAGSSPAPLRFGTILCAKSKVEEIVPEFAATMQKMGIKIQPIDNMSVDAVEAHVRQSLQEQVQSDSIPVLLPEVSQSRTILLLVTAAILEARWERRFTDTTDAIAFQTPQGIIKTPGIQRTDRFATFRTDDYEIIDLPYRGSSLSMRLVRPSKLENLSQILSTPQGLHEILTWNKDVPESLEMVKLVLPRFQVRFEGSLKPLLSKLGIQAAFSQEADFSGVLSSDELRLGEYKDQVQLQFDNEGTKVKSVVTAVGIAKGIAPEVRQITFDLPFLYLIRDRNGTVFFAGYIVNPDEH